MAFYVIPFTPTIHKNMETVGDIESLLTRKRFGCSNIPLMKEVVMKAIDWIKIKKEKTGTNIFINKMMKTYPSLREEIRSSTILLVYKIMVMGGEIEDVHGFEEMFTISKRKRDSGVSVFSVMTGSHPNGKALSCKYNCFNCPDPALPEPRAEYQIKDTDDEPPRSYPPLGPLTMRARNAKFDPRRQILDRAEASLSRGHSVDKIELKVSGGTLSSYPKDYLYGFFHELYYAANNLSSLIQGDVPEKLSHMGELEKNEFAKSKVIGVTVETRPDVITPEELADLIDMGGVTRVEVGIQHTMRKVLDRIGRQATDKHSHMAMLLLYACGFKCVAHIMFDLPQVLTDEAHERVRQQIAAIPGDNLSKEHRLEVRKVLRMLDPVEDIDRSVPMIAKDIDMFETFRNRRWADELKIYPNEATDYTDLPEWIRLGLYEPYSEELVLTPEERVDYERLKSKGELYGKDKKRMFEYKHKKNQLFLLLLNFVCVRLLSHWRVGRLGRDIPGTNIHGGMSLTNIRQILTEELGKMGKSMHDIYAREVRGRPFNMNNVRVTHKKYTVRGDPNVLEFEIDQVHIEVVSDDMLLGYLRLGFPPKKAPSSVMRRVYKVFPELRRTAMIRQLEVLGRMTKVGEVACSAQHRGYGKMMVMRACIIAKRLGYRRISVITSPGTRGYYRKLGFRMEGRFMVKSLVDTKIPNMRIVFNGERTDGDQMFDLAPTIDMRAKYLTLYVFIIVCIFLFVVLLMG